MRANMIWHVIKDDWYGHRQMIIGCLFIPLLLIVLLMWQDTVINHWFRNILDLDKTTVSSMVGVLVIFLPLIILWVSIFSRLANEAKDGFYIFIRTLPITPEELVTARMIASFVLSVGSALWFALLWRMYDPGFGQLPNGFAIWTMLCLIAFQFPMMLALHHALFFRSGAKGTMFGYVLFFLMIIGGRASFAKQGIQLFQAILNDYPVTTISIGTVLLITIWLLCWRWGMKVYRISLDGVSESPKTDQKRRVNE